MPRDEKSLEVVKTMDGQMVTLRNGASAGPTSRESSPNYVIPRVGSRRRRGFDASISALIQASGSAHFREMDCRSPRRAAKSRKGGVSLKKVAGRFPVDTCEMDEFDRINSTFAGFELGYKGLRFLQALGNINLRQSCL
jgi:hypothetical protein